MCPSCGGKRLEGERSAWCSVCGKISCPWCRSPRMIDGKRHSWEAPSLACQECGFHRELPMMHHRTKSDRKPAKLLRTCKTPGCTGSISERSVKEYCEICCQMHKLHGKAIKQNRTFDRVRGKI